MPKYLQKEQKIHANAIRQGPDAVLAKELGADIVGGPEIIPSILDGKLSFTSCLSTRSLFPHVIKIAKFLGPKGLMPSPAKGTVSDDIKAMLGSVKQLTKFEIDSENGIHLGNRFFLA